MSSVVISLLHSLRYMVRSRASLHLEIVALRHQLAVLNRSRRRLGFTSADRMLWAWLSQAWRGWRSAVRIVRPDTVVAWHRRGVRLFWTWKSRQRVGRPRVPHDIRALIREMSTANPLWGAPRIHGELQKLGVSVSQSTVAKYMRRHPRPPSQTWRTFLTNHASQIMAVDLFVVPTTSSAQGLHSRRRAGGGSGKGPCASRVSERPPHVTKIDFPVATALARPCPTLIRPASYTRNRGPDPYDQRAHPARALDDT